LSVYPIADYRKGRVLAGLRPLPAIAAPITAELALIDRF